MAMAVLITPFAISVISVCDSIFWELDLSSPFFAYHLSRTI